MGIETTKGSEQFLPELQDQRSSGPLLARHANIGDTARAKIVRAHSSLLSIRNLGLGKDDPFKINVDQDLLNLRKKLIKDGVVTALLIPKNVLESLLYLSDKYPAIELLIRHWSQTMGDFGVDLNEVRNDENYQVPDYAVDKIADFVVARNPLLLYATGNAVSAVPDIIGGEKNDKNSSEVIRGIQQAIIEDVPDAPPAHLLPDYSGITGTALKLYDEMRGGHPITPFEKGRSVAFPPDVLKYIQGNPVQMAFVLRTLLLSYGGILYEREVKHMGDEIKPAIGPSFRKGRRMLSRARTENTTWYQRRGQRMPHSGTWTERREYYESELLNTSLQLEEIEREMAIRKAGRQEYRNAQRYSELKEKYRNLQFKAAQKEAQVLREARVAIAMVQAADASVGADVSSYIAAQRGFASMIVALYDGLARMSEVGSRYSDAYDRLVEAKTTSDRLAAKEVIRKSFTTVNTAIDKYTHDLLFPNGNRDIIDITPNSIK